MRSLKIGVLAALISATSFTALAKDFYLKQGFKVTAQSTATISMHKTLKHEKQPYPDPTFSVLS